MTPVDPRGDIVPLSGANDVLGGNFLSRINMDLRETKGWSYGVAATLSIDSNAVPYIVTAPVQADRTGDSIAALNAADQPDSSATKGVTAGGTGARPSPTASAQLPGQFETSGAVLDAMQTQRAATAGPTIITSCSADRYRGADPASARRGAARQRSIPKGFVWVVVGDAAKVRPQLDKLGMPIEVMAAALVTRATSTVTRVTWPILRPGRASPLP